MVKIGFDMGVVEIAFFPKWESVPKIKKQVFVFKIIKN
jgi:hypothetical protein